jgi:hypothetical protein
MGMVRRDEQPSDFPTVNAFFTNDCDSLRLLSSSFVDSKSSKLLATSFETDLSNYRELTWISDASNSEDIFKVCLNSDLLKVIFPRQCYIDLTSSELMSVLIDDQREAIKFGEVIRRASNLNSIQKVDLTIAPFLNFIVFTLNDNYVVDVEYLCAR